MGARSCEAMRAPKKQTWHMVGRLRATRRTLTKVAHQKAFPAVMLPQGRRGATNGPAGSGYSSYIYNRCVWRTKQRSAAPEPSLSIHGARAIRREHLHKKRTNRYTCN